MKRMKYLLIFGMLAYCTAEFACAQTFNTPVVTPVYSGTLRSTTIDELDSVKKEFSEILNQVSMCITIRNGWLQKEYRSLPEDKGVLVTPDSVSFNLSKKAKCTFLCADKQEITICEYSDILYNFYILSLTNLEVHWKIKNLDYAKKFADDLVYFQHMKEFVRINNDSRFDSLAVQYRMLVVKPAISEEERRYIVQANAMAQSKNYNKAIELYENAIAIDLTNPMLYNNESLLLAMVGQYKYAINRIKKYLMLVPEAEDARAAKDKIYEWEAELENKNL